MSRTGTGPVVYVWKALAATGHATVIAIGFAPLAFPVLFIAVGLTVWWHYPRQMSLGHVTVLQTRNSPFHKVSSESWHMSMGNATFLQTQNSLFYKVSSES